MPTSIGCNNPSNRNIPPEYDTGNGNPNGLNNPDGLAWTTADALDNYNIPRWGCGYFNINEQGNLIVQPNGEGKGTMDMKELIDELPRVGTITFRRLTAELADRLSVIVRFLAILELYKQGVVELEQAANFAELNIIWLGVDAEEAGSEELPADDESPEGIIAVEPDQDGQLGFGLDLDSDTDEDDPADE